MLSFKNFFNNDYKKTIESLTKRIQDLEKNVGDVDQFNNEVLTLSFDDENIIGHLKTICENVWKLRNITNKMMTGQCNKEILPDLQSIIKKINEVSFFKENDGKTYFNKPESVNKLFDRVSHLEKEGKSNWSETQTLIDRVDQLITLFNSMRSEVDRCEARLKQNYAIFKTIEEHLNIHLIGKESPRRVKLKTIKSSLNKEDS